MLMQNTNELSNSRETSHQGSRLARALDAARLAWIAPASASRRASSSWRCRALMLTIAASSMGCFIDTDDSESIDWDMSQADAPMAGTASKGSPLGAGDVLGGEIYPPEEPDGPPQISGMGGDCSQQCLDQLASATAGCGGNEVCQSKALQKYTSCAQACGEDYPDP